MAEGIRKAVVIALLAERLNADESEAARWLDGVTETLYEAISAGETVTLTGFGAFYLKPRPDTWVFKFNPSQRLRSSLGWSSTFKGGK